MLAGAVGGLIGFGVGAIGVGAFGGGLAGAVISGAVGGGLAGGVGEALRQVATYGHIRNPQLLGAAMLSGVAVGGALGAVGYGIGRLARPAAASRPVQPYEVGTVDDLLNRSVPGDRLQVHHVPQAHPAGQVIPGYDPSTAPGIVLPDYEHQAIPNLTGTYSGTAHDSVARDLWNLRMHTGAPNSALQQLLNLIHQMYGF